MRLSSPFTPEQPSANAEGYSAEQATPPEPGQPHPEHIAALRVALRECEADYEEPIAGTFEVVLPGTKKLQTPLRLVVGPHSLGAHAFVCRCPDENFEQVYRWMLQANLRMFGVAFALDPAGDIFLTARLPLTVITPAEIDRLLGSVLEYADGSFNKLLELGFATAIRKEWSWRIQAGESTRNLEAFRQSLRLDELTVTEDQAARPHPES